MLRLFVTSNQISTVFCSTIARNTHKQGDIDILLIDNLIKKESLIKLIHQSSTIHSWKTILNLSKEVPDDFNLKPSFKKKIIRKIKFLPVIKTVYDASLKIFVQNKNKKEVEVVSQKINEVFTINPNTSVELFLLTQTSLNNSLINYFNNPVVNYYEHGLVDYLYVLEKNKINDFYAIFGDTFHDLLVKKGIQQKFTIKTYFTQEDALTVFPNFKFNADFLKGNTISNIALILLDSSEIFNVSMAFWTDYLEKCLSKIKSNSECLIIIKPHPGQSNEVLQLLRDYCKSKKNILLIDDPSLISVSVESIYISYKENIKYIFSTYSAASFYLAKFFDEGTDFYFLYEFIKPYYLQGPKQFTDAFTELEPYLKEVFSTEKCKFLN